MKRLPAFLPALCAALVIASADDRPNILFIMTDDHAAHAISCYGSKVNTTPHLDRLAAGGMIFKNAFVTNSICTPSRATILTGKYSHLNGTPVFNRFDGSQPTVAKMLQAAGYHTGMIGKWHLGSDPTGFDRWIVLPGQGVYHDPDFLIPEGRVSTKGYVTDIITDLGLRFLDTRPADKPFFLMLHHKAPHRPWDPDEKHRAQFADKDIPEPATLFDDYTTRPAALPENKQTIARDLTARDLKLAPPAGLTGDALIHWKYQRYMRDYLACVASVDDNIGRVLDYLDARDLAKNTLVIYTSDNGFFLGDHGLFDKRFMYEPSLRVPLIIRWPGVTKPGSTTDAMALNLDYAETFLDAAREKIPADMQGSSLVPLLKGELPDDWRTQFYYRYYHDPGDHNTRAHYGLRTATEKLIYYWKQDACEFFDLRSDPDELHNIAADPGWDTRLAFMKNVLTGAKAKAKDDDQFATEQPKPGVDGPHPDKKPLGEKTPAEIFPAR